MGDDYYSDTSEYTWDTDQVRNRFLIIISELAMAINTRVAKSADEINNCLSLSSADIDELLLLGDGKLFIDKTYCFGAVAIDTIDLNQLQYCSNQRTAHL